MLAAKAEAVEGGRATKAAVRVAPVHAVNQPFHTRIADGFFAMRSPLVTRSAQMLIETVSVGS